MKTTSTVEYVGLLQRCTAIIGYRLAL